MPGKILIVDDEAICVKMLEVSLIDEGFIVETASNGAEAVSKGIEFEPDVLISDWRLKHVVDGISVAKKLQSIREELKVILFSGSPSDEILAEASGLNIFMTLEKPLGIDDVLKGIRQALGETTNRA